MDKEAIHHFRVEIKKLRAFLRLLQPVSEAPVTIPRALKKIYRRAGALRDLQLQHETDITEDYSAKHLRHIDLQTEAAVKKLRKAMRRRSLKSAYDKLRKKLPKHFQPTIAQQFYTKKTAAIRSIITATSMPDKQLHQLRKHLKDILYNAAIFEKEMNRPFPVGGWSSEKEDFYTRLADELGKFIDTTVALQHIEHSPSARDKTKKKAIDALTKRRQLQQQHVVVSLNESYSTSPGLFS